MDFTIMSVAANDFDEIYDWLNCKNGILISKICIRDMYIYICTSAFV